MMTHRENASRHKMPIIFVIIYCYIYLIIIITEH